MSKFNRQISNGINFDLLSKRFVLLFNLALISNISSQTLINKTQTSLSVILSNCVFHFLILFFCIYKKIHFLYIIYPIFTIYNVSYLKSIFLLSNITNVLYNLIVITCSIEYQINSRLYLYNVTLVLIPSTVYFFDLN